MALFWLLPVLCSAACESGCSVEQVEAIENESLAHKT